MELNWPLPRNYKVLSGIHDYARHHGNWDVDLTDYPEQGLADGRRYDGIVGRIGDECYEAGKAAGIPMVNVWINSVVYPKLPGVYIDMEAAGRMVAEHLVARGFRRLVHLGYRADRSSREHHKGMRQVADQNGIPCLRHLFSHLFEENRQQWRRFTQYIERCLDQWDPPIGIGTVGDMPARSVASISQWKGWRIPEQLAVVGLGNNPLVCDAVEPTLSCIDRGDHQNGFEAARLLDRLMDGQPAPSEPMLTPPRELVVRHSSDVFSVGDPLVARALRFMADHARGPLSVPQIAEAIGLGRQTLERRFKRHVGRTINEELIRLRVETLKRFLVESDEPVKTLGAEAGFGTPVSMHTAFKRHTGMTPVAYRKKHNPKYEFAPREHPG